MMFSSVWMAQPFLFLTLHGRWDKGYKDTSGDEANRYCLLHASSGLGSTGRKMTDSVLADLRGH